MDQFSSHGSKLNSPTDTAVEGDHAADMSKKRIVFFCQEFGNAWWPGWGPSSIRTHRNSSTNPAMDETLPTSTAGGVGGSEEAVIFVSQELAKMGYRVEVYGDPPHADQLCPTVDHRTSRTILTPQVCWYHYSAYNIAIPPDVFISWRYPLSLSLGRGAGVSFLWLHDLVSPNFFPPSFAADSVGFAWSYIG